MNEAMILAGAVVMGIGATGAALSDLRTRRVPNWLSAALLLGGIVFRAATGDPLTVVLGAAGALLAGLLLLLPFAAGWLGAGDVKLAAALGAWLGPLGAALATLLGIVGGGLIAALMIAISGAPTRARILDRLWTSVRTLALPAPSPGRALSVPLAVPLGASAVGVLLALGL